MVVTIDGALIKDWDTFHDVFTETLGFPGWYGRNMNAWIDCMSCVDDPDAGMTKVQVPSGTVLTIAIDNVDSFSQRCPEQYAALVECTAFVNWRCAEDGGPALLALAFDKR